MRIEKSTGSLLAVLVMGTILFGSCMKTDDFSANEQQNIDNFLANNPDLAFTKKESGLYYYEVSPGTGEALRDHDTAFVVYTGKFLDGAVFDTNIGGDTLGFAVGEEDVIPGFDEGVSYMKEGSKSMLIIPSSLAYGPTGWGFIPGYTPLLFEVTLTKILRGPGK